MKKISLIFFVLLTVTLVKSQDIGVLFKSVPFEIVPVLSEEDKDMMLMDTGVVTIHNPLGQITKVEHTDSFIKIKTSEVGTIQIKLLSADSDNAVISVVRTVCSDMCDSSIQFYNLNWEEQSKERFFPGIDINYFLDIDRMNKDTSAEVHSPLFFPYEMEFQKNSDDIVVRVDAASLYPKSLTDTIKSYINNEKLVLMWDGKRYSVKD